jgi:hypothetical protein
MGRNDPARNQRRASPGTGWPGLGLYNIGELVDWIGAVVDALILLVIYRLVTRGRAEAR